MVLLVDDNDSITRKQKNMYIFSLKNVLSVKFTQNIKGKSTHYAKTTIQTIMAYFSYILLDY